MFIVRLGKRMCLNCEWKGWAAQKKNPGVEGMIPVCLFARKKDCLVPCFVLGWLVW